ncbi:MAG: DUF421 domain-containing protein [Candidatus Rokuibacteriota bacterium]|nr:MAG: DUF421 domain-containing protein [Candidatus Rokubacteria bacterium]
MDIALRAIVLYAFLIFVMRVTGRRELSALSPVDLVLLIVLGDAIQQGLTQDDYSVTGAVIAVATIATMQVGASYVSFRSRRARKVLEGDPIVIVQDGKLLDANMARERMTPDEVAEEMRLQQIASFDEVAWAIVERNGQISFVRKQSA